MPPKAGDAPAAASQAWMQAAAERLDFYERTLRALQEELRAAPAGDATASSEAASSSGGKGKGQAEPTAAWPAPAGSMRARAKPPSYGVLPPREVPRTSEAELATLRLGRTSPLGFSPLRRAAMIEGRPVVVPVSTSRWCVRVQSRGSSPPTPPAPVRPLAACPFLLPAQETLPRLWHLAPAAPPAPAAPAAASAPPRRP